MRIRGPVCDKHSVPAVVSVSKRLKEAWEKGEAWDSDRYVVIRHQMFAVDDRGFPDWVTREEALESGLSTTHVLDDDETEQFLEWQSGRMTFMCHGCFEEWSGESGGL